MQGLIEAVFILVLATAAGRRVCDAWRNERTLVHSGVKSEAVT